MIILSFPGSVLSLKRRALGGAIDIRHWGAFLRHLTDRLPGTSGEIVYRSHDLRQPLLGFADGMFRAVPSTETASLDLRFATGDPFTTTRVDPLCGGMQGVALVLDQTGAGTWLLRLWFKRADGRAQAPAGFLALLSRLAPTLRRVFSLALRLGHGDVPARDALETVWDRLACGLFLVAPDRRLLFANMAAEDILRDRTLFRPSHPNGTLSLASPELRDEMDEALFLVGEGRSRRCGIDVVPTGRGDALRIDVRDARLPTMPLFYPRHTQGRPAYLVMRIERREEAVPAALDVPTSVVAPAPYALRQDRRSA